MRGPEADEVFPPNWQSSQDAPVKGPIGYPLSYHFTNFMLEKALKQPCLITKSSKQTCHVIKGSSIDRSSSYRRFLNRPVISENASLIPPLCSLYSSPLVSSVIMWAISWAMISGVLSGSTFRDEKLQKWCPSGLAWHQSDDNLYVVHGPAYRCSLDLQRVSIW